MSAATRAIAIELAIASAQSDMQIPAELENAFNAAVESGDVDTARWRADAILDFLVTGGTT